METAWLIYWYLTVGNFLFWALIMLAAPCLGCGFMIFLNLDLDDNGVSVWFKRFCKWGIPFCILILIKSFYPSKTDLAYIFGGTALVSVAQSEEAQKLPDNLLRAANAFLEGVADPTVTEGE